MFQVSNSSKRSDFAHATVLHDGEQTISDLPNTRFDISCPCCRCLPHLKQERVLPEPRNGEPEGFAA